MLIGQAALEQANLGERATSLLQELVLAVGETVSLAELSGVHARIVKRVEAEVVVRAQVRVGTLLSLNNSASGRVLTAFATPQQRQLLKTQGAVLAGATLLNEVKNSGYAISAGTDTPGAQPLGMPVFDGQGRCAFAMSVVAPVSRFDAERDMGPLTDASHKLSGVMSGKG